MANEGPGGLVGSGLGAAAGQGQVATALAQHLAEHSEAALSRHLAHHKQQQQQQSQPPTLPSVSVSSSSSAALATVRREYERAIASADECDTFFCFTLLVGPIQDWFVQLDGAQDALPGVAKALSQFETMLEAHDPALVAHLRDLGLKPEYYALRWLTMFFAQVVAFPPLSPPQY